ncbi:MAG TPA: hypothetical protein VND91_11355, partial [Candidatus Saccharimonadia bacterium]|nr:hypothetical protein [Candidatus Saccharimonadia bacterium]
LDEAVANAWIDSMQAKAAADQAARAVTPAAKTDDGGAAAAISSASATTAAAAPTTPDAAPPGDAARAAAPQPGAQSPGNEPPGAPIEAPLAVTDPARDREQQLAKLRDEVAQLQRKFEGWAFVLPNYKFANMNKTMDDLLKPLAGK